MPSLSLVDEMDLIKQEGCSPPQASLAGHAHGRWEVAQCRYVRVCVHVCTGAVVTLVFVKRNIGVCQTVDKCGEN